MSPVYYVELGLSVTSYSPLTASDEIRPHLKKDTFTLKLFTASYIKLYTNATQYNTIQNNAGCTPQDNRADFGPISPPPTILGIVLIILVVLNIILSDFSVGEVF